MADNAFSEELEEQRFSERVQMFFFIDIYLEDSEKKVGNTIDLNSEGMRLLMPSMPEVGAVGAYVIRINDEPSRDIHLTAECRWAEQTESTLQYEAGFQFIEVSVADRKRLQHVIEDASLGVAAND